MPENWECPNCHQPVPVGTFHACQVPINTMSMGAAGVSIEREMHAKTHALLTQAVGLLRWCRGAYPVRERARLAFLARDDVKAIGEKHERD